MKAVGMQMASRWSGARPECGRAWGWIVGNEVNSPWMWSNMGKKALPDAVANYAQAFRIFHGAVRSASGNARLYISFGHHHAHEGGLRLGLWRNAPNSIADPHSKKQVWEVFLKAGTPEWDAAASPLLPVTGLKSWDELSGE